MGSSLSRSNYLTSIIRRLLYGNGDRKWEWTLSRDRGRDQLIDFSCLHYTPLDNTRLVISEDSKWSCALMVGKDNLTVYLCHESVIKMTIKGFE